MSRFHSLAVKSITRETPDCVSVSFDVPAELRETFSYVPGQYLTLRRTHGGEELRRSYSLCSSPLDDEWRVAIKRVPGGRFSNLVVGDDGLRPGDRLDVMPPQGRFTPPALRPENAKLYVLFAAGSGITPVFSIAKTVLLAEPDSQVYLVYGNRGRNSIIFKEGIEALKNKFLRRLSVYHVLSREQGDADLLFGRIDREKTTQFLQKIVPAGRIDECFICGPEEMIVGVREALADAGVAPEKVHFELFATGVPKAAQGPSRPAGTDDQKSQVTVQLDGRAYRLDMSYYGDTILDAALTAGADAPYSCKNGMCSTCRARITEGTAAMDVNYSLSEDEIARGYILTCQARPTAAQVAVDFDQ